MAVLLRQSPRGPEPASRSPACEPDPQWGAGERETKTPVYQSQEVPENIRNPGLVPPPRSLCHYRVNIISGCWKTFPLKNYAFLREKKPVPPDFFFKLKKKKKKKSTRLDLRLPRSPGGGTEDSDAQYSPSAPFARVTNNCSPVWEGPAPQLPPALAENRSLTAAGAKLCCQEIRQVR